MLDLDLQLLGRIARLLATSGGGAVDQAALAEQHRQADMAADVAADTVLDDIVTRDLLVPGAQGSLAARLYVRFTGLVPATPASPPSAHRPGTPRALSAPDRAGGEPAHGLAPAVQQRVLGSGSPTS
jgi:hypothetical protein